MRVVIMMSKSRGVPFHIGCGGAQATSLRRGAQITTLVGHAIAGVVRSAVFHRDTQLRAKSNLWRGEPGVSATSAGS
jgi:hypothetical protein